MGVGADSALPLVSIFFQLLLVPISRSPFSGPYGFYLEKVYHPGKENNRTECEELGRLFRGEQEEKQDEKDTGCSTAGISFHIRLCLFPEETGGKVIRINCLEQEGGNEVNHSADRNADRNHQQLF